MIGSKLYRRIESESWRRWPGKPSMPDIGRLNTLLLEETTGAGIGDGALLNANLPSILKGLPIDTNPFFSSLENAEELFRMAIRVALNPRYFSHIELFVGFSVSAGINVRLPAYILPIIQFLQGLLPLKEEGIISELPNVRLFWAENAAALCNGMEIEEAKERGQESRAYVEAFLWKFYPELACHFTFSADANWATNEFAHGFVQHLADWLGDYALDGNVALAIGKIKAMGRKHGGDAGEASALKYAALHAIYPREIQISFSDAFFSEVDADQTAPEVVISLGARTEKLFLQVRRFLVSEMMANGNGIGAEFPLSVQYFVPIGATAPVYYPDKDGDMTLEDVAAGATLETSKLGKTAKKDLQLLTQEGFWDFVRDYAQALIMA